MPFETGALFADWPLQQEPTSPIPGSATPETPAAPPRFQTIDRRQSFLRAVDVEALIDEGHAARAIWSIVEQLDLSAFCEPARSLEGLPGRPAIHPCLLASLWIYAYSQGVGSAREISRLCSYHPAYQWLTGAEELSGHTLSDFRGKASDRPGETVCRSGGRPQRRGIRETEPGDAGWHQGAGVCGGR